MMFGDVGIIGPGRAGTLVAVAAANARLRVRVVAGGSPSARDALVARIAGVRAVDTISDVARAATLVVVATPDAAIEGVVRQLAIDDVIGVDHRVVHLSGALGLDPLRLAELAGAGVAACHPAMTIPAGAPIDALIGAAWGVTAGVRDETWAFELVTLLGGEPHRIAEHDRVIYHAALAAASNAVGAAVSVARQLLLATRVPRPDRFLQPLIASSVANVLAEGAGALTGPVVRGDVATLARHLAAIDADLPELSTSYRALARAIMHQSRHQLDGDVYRALATALEPDNPGGAR